VTGEQGMKTTLKDREVIVKERDKKFEMGTVHNRQLLQRKFTDYKRLIVY
jgi:hypothetical protein